MIYEPCDENPTGQCSIEPLYWPARLLMLSCRELIDQMAVASIALNGI